MFYEDRTEYAGIKLAEEIKKMKKDKDQKADTKRRPPKKKQSHIAVFLVGLGR
ncbi:hypothetical protein JW698_02490 [Candidatus Wolfebacteria bacterium]|nr:hypothetical protein [Candidatus Wolfebacteria bacterium]